ncbi:MAG TPA: hypothetical protein VE710_14715 [Candidatus Bathyarchaeia archaeon]|nr:hypothetical protein [Candidatus Bathyarchaeia archaeon]
MEELIELAIVLVVKFWPVILAFLGFKAIGKLKGDAKNKAGSRRPVLTPVHGGGMSQPRPGNVISPTKEETIEPKYAETHSLVDLREDSSAPDHVLEASLEEPIETASVQRNVPVISAREGMKWALIFSPPRAKMPYAPHEYQKKR